MRFSVHRCGDSLKGTAVTQDSIHGLVFRALRGSELAVASPATIQKAIENGESISMEPPLSIDAAINKLFDRRREHALSLASTLLLCRQILLSSTSTIRLDFAYFLG
jgi:hypothetical protein